MLIRSDARHIPLADESVHCCITSPPYWGLRAYEGSPGMIGLEPTFDEHLENLVEVFREVRRALRKDGTLWLNYGDAYWGGKGQSNFAYAASHTDRNTLQKSYHHVAGEIGQTRPTDGKHPTLKPKDLMMMPARVAMALQADGWYLRSQIPWLKRNPMPESVEDRPASAIEYVYLLTKSSRCFYDSTAIRKQPSPDTEARYERGRSTTHKWADGGPGNQTIAKTFGHMRKPDKQRGHSRRHNGFNDNWDKMSKGEQQANGRSFRNTDLMFQSLKEPWGLILDSEGNPLAIDVPPKGYKGAHFATFPEKLAEPFILAGTSEKGCCSECGAPWVRKTEVGYRKNRPSAGNDPRSRSEDRQAKGSMGGHRGWKGNNLLKETSTAGWSPTCEHEADPVPAVVLDIFAGSGTVVRVAERFNRRGIGCDLTYQDIAKKRTANIQRRLI